MAVSSGREAVASRATAVRRAAAVKRAAAARRSAPSLREERRLLRLGHRWLAAVDEVGRGALAGPVSVGVVLIDLETGSAPSGVRDSKLLTAAAREKLVPRLMRWAPHHAVGHTQAEEIDRIGIIPALRLAACRALAQLPVQPDCALLDGNHNWLHAPTAAARAAARAALEAGGTGELFELEPDPSLAVLEPSWVPTVVVTRVKADLRCAAVAAASVLAKVERDLHMVELSARHPGYGWADNKGYSAPEHIDALRRLGATPLHRQSWSLPGLFSLDGSGPGQVTIEDFAGVGVPEAEILDLTALSGVRDVLDLYEGELADELDMELDEADVDDEVLAGAGLDDSAFEGLEVAGPEAAGPEPEDDRLDGLDRA